MSTLSERLMKVALLGVVPDDDQHVIADANAEIERLRALLNDRTYIRCKADYNRGHLSHAHYLNSKERGLGLADEQKADEIKPHVYVPSALHMGDCAVCGHRHDASIHCGEI